MLYRAGAAVIVLGGLGGLGGAASGCGDGELFIPELEGNERLIEQSAFARLTLDDAILGAPVVAGDLDGDGIDDAIAFEIIPDLGPPPAGSHRSQLYIVYGGAAVHDEVDVSSLPRLTGFPDYAFSLSVATLGDVDGDGLADFMITALCVFECSGPAAGGGLGSAAYLVYGRSARLAGATPIVEAAVVLRDARPAASIRQAIGLGDLDGDGVADFAFNESDTVDVTGNIDVLVFHGRHDRLVATDDVGASADAVLVAPKAQIGLNPRIVPAGDVDGDGHDDFLVEQSLVDAPGVLLVKGAATRLAGELALGEVASSRFEVEQHCFLGGIPPGSALGDLDGDGFDDVAVVGCSMVGDSVSPTRVTERVYYGRAGGFPARVSLAEATATVTLISSGPVSIVGADVDGDGVRDLLVSDPDARDGDGVLHVFSGQRDRWAGPLDPAAQATGYVGTHQRGSNCDYVRNASCTAHERIFAATGVGDLNGDHRVDLVVGAPTDQGVLPELGVHGSALGHSYLVTLSGAPNP
jgi:hypothetical protein